MYQMNSDYGKFCFINSFANLIEKNISISYAFNLFNEHEKNSILENGLNMAQLSTLVRH